MLLEIPNKMLYFQITNSIKKNHLFYYLNLIFLFYNINLQNNCVYNSMVQITNHTFCFYNIIRASTVVQGYGLEQQLSCLIACEFGIFFFQLMNF